MTYTRTVRVNDIDRYRGRRARMSVYLRSDNVRDDAGPYLTAMNTITTLAATFGRRPLPVKGTVGWLRYTVTLDVPKEADSLEMGVLLRGSGTIWIDTIDCEAVEK